MFRKLYSETFIPKILFHKFCSESYEKYLEYVIWKSYFWKIKQLFQKFERMREEIVEVQNAKASI